MERIRRKKSKSNYQQLQESAESFQKMFRHHGAVMLLIDPESGRIVQANRAACRFYGYTEEQFLSMTIREINTLPTSEVAKAMQNAVLDGINAIIFPHRLANGEIRRVEVSSYPIEIQQKRFLYSIIFDITEKEQAQQLEKFYRQVIEDSLYEIYIFAADTLRFQRFNRGAYRNLGYTEEELLGMTPIDLKPEFDETGFRALLAPLLQGEQDQIRFSTVHRRKDGSLYPVKIQLQMFRIDQKSVFVAFILDVTEARKKEEEWLEREAILQGITDSTNEAILLMDGEGNISFWNPAAERLLGYTRQEAIGRNLHNLIMPTRYREAHEKGWERFRQTAQGKLIGKTTEVEALHKDRHAIEVELSLAALHFNEVWYTVGVIRDVTERKQAERLLFQMSITDPLTGAYNRRYFVEVLEKEMARATRTASPLSLVMMDLDHFKKVNDQFGHAAGDRVLQEFVTMIQKRIRQTDCLARWGGEEFVLLLPDCPLAAAVELADGMRRNVPMIPFALEKATVTASFGVTENAPVDTVDIFVQRADALLYEAKTGGRNAVRSVARE